MRTDEVLGFLRGVHGLDHHRGPDTARPRDGRKLIDVESAAQLRRGPLKPIMLTLDRVPHVKVGVDDRSWHGRG